jgi:superfamily II DNA or RNA helicase
MIEFHADANQNRQKLIEIYHELQPIERKLVQLLSIIYEPISRTALTTCFNQSGERDPNGKVFTTSTIRPYIERLLELGLLAQSSSQGVQCQILLAEIATRDAVQSGQFESMASIIEKKFPVYSWTSEYRYFKSNFQFIREVRIGVYRKDIEFIRRQIHDFYTYGYQSSKISLPDLYQFIFNNPFDKQWFRELPEEMYESVLVDILEDSILRLVPANEAFSLLQEDCAIPGNATEQKYSSLIEQLIFRNRFDEAQEVLERFFNDFANSASMFEAWLSFLQGEDEQAIEQYHSALQGLKKESGKRSVYFSSISGLFFILALLRQGSAESLDHAIGYASRVRKSKHWLSSTYELLGSLAQLQQGDLSQKEWIAQKLPQEADSSIDMLLRALGLYWVNPQQAKKKLPQRLESIYDQAEAADYHWLSMEIAELLSRLKPQSKYGKQASLMRGNSEICPLVDLIHPKEVWELCLKALSNLRRETPVMKKAASNQRLAWFITFYPSTWMLQPREQTLNAKGDWGKGRPVALKRLTAPDDFDYLTPQDRRICSYIKKSNAWGTTEFSFGDRAILALIGHPLVFWEDASMTRIEVVQGEPELQVTKHSDTQLILKLIPQLDAKRDIFLVKETPTRLKVIEITAEHRRIAEILGQENRLEVPATAKEQVLAAINAVSSLVTVHSDIGGGMGSAEAVPADPTPHVHLLPAGTGLKVALLVRPFAQAGPYYGPGRGGETVIAEIEGRRLQTCRDLGQEKQLAQAVVSACPSLEHQIEQEGERWVDDPEDCLELLLELQSLGETVVLEWPEGEKLRVRHQATLQDLQLMIQRQNDWFATSGELRVDDTLVLDMQQLLALMEQTPGRFIPLGDGQFLALTQEFRQRLDELRTFSEKHGKGLRVHPLAALALQDWVDEVGTLKADKHWKAHIQRLQAVEDLVPTLPSTLQAELRDYQVDGFRWLARLAHWGVGACLADDMGLGKTLEALALILSRAPEGPTLVVAPTSVCMNWLHEAQRFAPTLKPIQFGTGESALDRQQQRRNVLDSLEPLDLVICSYGLLQQEESAELLGSVEWQTVVLDEAQSIKNFATKRSQAAMNLKAGFKLITTGTPIENHLGELWNLFRFINPGLLGSLESFNRRFANPIEKLGDKQARNRLKMLVQPFLLRRTKNQVLQELPSRTEILLQVDLSREEMAFYEALRQTAIAKLSGSDAVAGAKHLQVLAEIMKLRRACCNTQLVNSSLSLPSSKLQLFGEVLSELLENQHKVLVFSQFVDHLQLIRDYLEQRQIVYQYLDGSTPAAERKKRVDAFQAGTGDVFLISLKAGGTGLNLTAADYVIHMDPWWNPAVEDQASDRAHRIGQLRPVTIYRLVAKNTIEDKIVQLHQQKRELADSLLEGTDFSGKLSTEDLLRLIQEV